MARSSTTWQSGKTGNPAGRPKGLRDKRALLRYKLTRHLPAILKTLTDAAKGGDIQAAKLILERTLPALKTAAEPLTLPGADTPASQGWTVLGACAQATSPPMRPRPSCRPFRGRPGSPNLKTSLSASRRLRRRCRGGTPMSGLRARIIRLERNVPTGFEAELRALTDEELEARIDKLLAAVTEADVLDLMQRAPCRFGLLERWRKLQRESIHASDTYHTAEAAKQGRSPTARLGRRMDAQAG